MTVKATVKLYKVLFMEMQSDGVYEVIDTYIDSDSNKALKGGNEYAKEKGYNDNNYIIKSQVIITKEEREIEL